MNRASGIHEGFDWGKKKSSVYTLEFDVPRQSRSDFFSALERYAQAHNFEFTRSRIHPVKEQFSIDFSRTDVAMSGANIWDISKYQLAFYIDQKRGGSLDKVRELTESLGRDMQGVPGIVWRRR